MEIRRYLPDPVVHVPLIHLEHAELLVVCSCGEPMVFAGRVIDDVVEYVCEKCLMRREKL